LAAQIDSFAVKKKTSCFELAKSLAATSEVRKVLAAYGTSYRERDFSGALHSSSWAEFCAQHFKHDAEVNTE